MKLTRAEQETIINFNEEEKTASVYTHNSSIRRRLDQLFKTRFDEMKLVRSSEDYAEYIVPKKWIKISPPKQMSDEFKEAARKRLASYRQSAENENGSLGD